VIEDGQPVGIVDVIDGYPRAATMFIGLLAIVEGRQGNGIGRAVVRELESYARTRWRASRMRLAVVATNPVVGFWDKMGFRLTGETRTYEGEALTSTVSLMEKTVEERA